MRLILVISVALTVISGTASADPVAAKGVGVTECAEYLQKYRADPELTETVYFSWAQGFMSGWNYKLLNLKQPVYDLSSQSMGQQQAFIRDYCTRKPGATYSEAVLMMYLTLAQRPAP